MVGVGAEWINVFPGPCNQNTLSYCDETSRGVSQRHDVTGPHEGRSTGETATPGSRTSATSASAEMTATGPTTSISSTSPSHGGTGFQQCLQGYFGTQRHACTWRSDQARYGDNWNLEYLCIDACNSLELTRNVIAVWQNTFQRLHQIFAFTDLVSDSWWTGGRGYDFGRRAGNNEVLSNAWLDECYSSWLDDNPVAMAAGRTPADAINRLNNERVFSGFGDIPNNQITWFQWKWRS